MTHSAPWSAADSAPCAPSTFTRSTELSQLLKPPSYTPVLTSCVPNPEPSSLAVPASGSSSSAMSCTRTSQSSRLGNWSVVVPSSRVTGSAEKAIFEGRRARRLLMGCSVGGSNGLPWIGKAEAAAAGAGAGAGEGSAEASMSSPEKPNEKAILFLICALVMLEKVLEGWWWATFLVSAVGPKIRDQPRAGCPGLGRGWPTCFHSRCICNSTRTGQERHWRWELKIRSFENTHSRRLALCCTTAPPDIEHRHMP